MKHLSIIVHGGQNNISSIVGTHEIFTKANDYWKKRTGKELFKIELVGITKKVDFEDGLFSAKVGIHIGAVQKTNLIIIPSLNHNYKAAEKGNKILVEWIKQQYSKGAEIASMCSGAFMLAASGLVDGKSCSTHWAYANTFKAMFPQVNLQADKLITDENGIYTNGGAYSFLHLLIYLIEKYYDRQTAIYCAKIFQVEMDRSSQSPFAIFAGQKQHEDEIVQKAQAYIESRVEERISIEELSAMFAVGRRNFDRRFIKATGNTPLEYIQRLKIEFAKKAFETSHRNINEVMYDVGYSDIKAFREVFKKITGISPLEYRNKYNKEAVVQ